MGGRLAALGTRHYLVNRLMRKKDGRSSQCCFACFLKIDLLHPTRLEKLDGCDHLRQFQTAIDAALGLGGRAVTLFGRVIRGFDRQLEQVG